MMQIRARNCRQEEGGCMLALAEYGRLTPRHRLYEFIAMLFSQATMLPSSRWVCGTVTSARRAMWRKHPGECPRASASRLIRPSGGEFFRDLAGTVVALPEVLAVEGWSANQGENSWSARSPHCSPPSRSPRQAL